MSAVALGLRLMKGEGYEKLRQTCPPHRRGSEKWNGALLGFCRDVRRLVTYVDEGDCIRPDVIYGIETRIRKVASRAIEPKQKGLILAALNQIERIQLCQLPPPKPMPTTYEPPCQKVSILEFPEGPRGWFYRAVYAASGIAPTQLLCAVPKEWAGAPHRPPQCYTLSPVSLSPETQIQSTPIAPELLESAQSQPTPESSLPLSLENWVHAMEPNIADFAHPSRLYQAWKKLRSQMEIVKSKAWLTEARDELPAPLFNAMRRFAILVDNAVQELLHSASFSDNEKRAKLGEILSTYWATSNAWVGEFFKTAVLHTVEAGQPTPKTTPVSQVLMSCKTNIDEIPRKDLDETAITSIANILYQVNLWMVSYWYDTLATRGRLPSAPPPLREAMQKILDETRLYGDRLGECVWVGILFGAERTTAHYHFPFGRFKCRLEISCDQSGQVTLNGAFIGKSPHSKGEIRKAFSLLERQPFVHPIESPSPQAFLAPFSWKLKNQDDLISLIYTIRTMGNFYSGASPSPVVAPPAYPHDTSARPPSARRRPAR